MKIRDCVHWCWSLLGLTFLKPRLRLLCFAAIGVLVGLGLLVGHVSRATSYMSNDSAACINCHVMQSAYASWQRSSHVSVANCNDCHVPHDSLFHAYAFKARDGIYHSSIFTLRLEPQVIHLSKGAQPVVQSNCVHCHEPVFESIDPKSNPKFCGVAMSGSCVNDPTERQCWDCHREVPHGHVRSLSATPGAMVPQLPAAIKRQVPQIRGRSPRADQNK